ncbi:T9SS type A sorting domain-containing protein [bacterium SCSIO 12741]|nr:T9SS type A sorting domain-containing protein [bacterium SCSIO 12741]
MVDGVMEAVDLVVTVFNNSSNQRRADSLALVDFYNSTNGTGWTYQANWLSTTATIDTWEGVLVQNCRVTKIDLPGNNIDGTFPTSFQNLTELRTLNLPSNQLTSTFTMDQLKNLQWVNLQYNQINQIITNGSKDYYEALTYFNVSDNQCTGTTLNIKGMPKLYFLSMYQCGFSGLDLHTETSEVDYYGSLNEISANNNNLAGSFDISAMPVLVRLQANVNQLSGFVTRTGGNNDLRDLILSSNSFVGGALDVSGAPNLKLLFAESAGLGAVNMLSTMILEDVRLSSNQLSSFDPTPMAATLRILYLQHNNLLSQFTLGTPNYPSLTHLGLLNSPLLTGTLDISNAPVMQWFRASSCSYSDFIFYTGANYPLNYVNVAYNDLVQLDVRNKPNLVYLFAEHNDLTTLQSGTYVSTNMTVNISNNNLIFNDIIPNLANFSGTITYSPQAKVPVIPGLNSVSVAADFTGTSYEWREQGQTPVLSANRIFNYSAPATYYCEMNNSLAPALTLYSENYVAPPAAPPTPSPVDANSSNLMYHTGGTSVDQRRVYPNPVHKKDNVIIENITFSSTDQVSIQLVSLNGSTVQTIDPNQVTANDSSIQIPIEVKKEGFYLIQLMINDEVSAFRISVED